MPSIIRTVIEEGVAAFRSTENSEPGNTATTSDRQRLNWQHQKATEWQLVTPGGEKFKWLNRDFIKKVKKIMNRNIYEKIY